VVHHRVRSRTGRCVVVAACSAAVALASGRARADEHSTINRYGDHPSYVFEAEPHGLIGFGYPFDYSNNIGIGFRGTFHLTNGFVSSINDSIGIGVGFDFAPGNGGFFIVPVVLQWNFWLSTHWSVFGEPGLAFTNGPLSAVLPAFYAGGRFHFTERIALTLRVGYPDVSVGVSFLL
jgi:hypothetical protein